jgi:hypothetical protein
MVSYQHYVEKTLIPFLLPTMISYTFHISPVACRVFPAEDLYQGVLAAEAASLAAPQCCPSLLGRC